MAVVKRVLSLAAAAAATGAFSIANPVAMSADAGPPAGEKTAEQRCLALSMYWEARSEGAKGMKAVGSVVLNRIESDEFPDTACAVVYQGGETPPCQFSWWCDGRSDLPRESRPWSVALDFAAEMLANRTRRDDPTKGALFFHHARIAVPWRVKRVRTVRIRDHIYYR